MSKKVEIEISIQNREAGNKFKETQQGMEDISRTAKETGGNLSELEIKASSACEAFLRSYQEVGRLKSELKDLAEGGASFDALIKKVEELVDAEKETIRAGESAQASQHAYISALQASGEETEEAARKNTLLLRATGEMSSEIEKASSLLDTYRKKLEEVGNTTEETSEQNDKASVSAGGLSEILRKVPGPLGDTARGMKLLTKEAMAFVATPVGMVLAAISAALALVSSWLHRTEEGERALNVATGAFTGTLNTLLDVADNVGEWLYKAFTRPKEALDDLWSTLKNKLLSDMKRVADMGAGIVKIFSGNVSEGWGQVANAWSGFGVNGIVGRAAENGRKQAALSTRQNNLDKQQRDWLVERERIESRIAELRGKMYDSSVKDAEKSKAIAEAKRLTNSLYDKEISMAKEQHSIIEETNKLSHSSIADKTKENEALAKTISLEKDRSNALRMLNRNEGTLNKRGSSASEKAGKEDAKARQKLFEQDIAAEESQSKQRRTLRSALRDLEIAREEDDARRELLQMQKDHDDKIAAIRQQEEEWKKEAYKAAEERWNATNKDKTKTFADTAEGKAGWQGQNLTSEQKQTIQAQVDAENAIFDRSVKERYRQQRQELLDYIKEYGSIQDRRAAITKEYDEKIARETDAVQKAALEKQKKQLLSELDMEEIKKSLDWEVIFNDLDSQSTKSLESLKEKLRTALTSGDVSAENAKVLAEKIREIEDKLSQRKDPFSAWLPGLRERLRLTNQVKEAEDKVAAAAKDISRLTVKSNSDLLKIQSNIKFASGGKVVGVNDISKMTSEEYVKLLNLDPLSEAGRQATEEFNGLIVSSVDLQKAQENLTQAQKDASTRQQALASFTKGGSVAQYFKDVTKGFDFGQWMSYIDMNAQSMAEFTDKIGLAGTDFGDAVHGFADGVSGFSSAVQALANGDIFGAVNGVIGGLEGFGKGFGAILGLNADYSDYEDALKKYQNLSKIWDELISKKREYLSESWGGEALAASKEALELVKAEIAEAKAVGERFLGSGASAGSSSQNYRHWDNDGWKYVAPAISKELGVQFNSMYDLLDMTPEQLEWIKTNFSQLWGIMSEGIKEPLEDIIKYGEVQEEIIEQTRERLMSASFDDVFDSALDSLREFANSGKSVMDGFADNWQEKVNEMVINTIVGDEMKEKLRKWFDGMSDELQALEEDKGNITEEEYLARYNAIINKYGDGYKGIMQWGEDTVNGLINAGIIKTTENITTVFDDLRDTFRDSLTDMEDDAEAFGKRLHQTMLKDLIEKQVLDVPITVNGMTFDDFDAYVKDWNRRYSDAVKSGNEEAINALIDELIQVRELTAQQAEELRQRLKDTFENDDDTFSGMSDSFTSKLMDMTANAEDWAQEVGKAIAEKIIKEMVASNMIQPLLDDLQEAFNTAIDAEGATSSSVIAAIMPQLEALKEAYPELQEIVKDIMDALGLDTLTTEGFGDLRSTFVSALTDIKKDADDFGKDIAKTLLEQMIDELVKSRYQQQMDDISQRWREALAAGDTDAIEELQNEILALYETIGNDDAVNKLTEDLKKLTREDSTPFDNWRDSFRSSLMDMSKDAKDFTKDISEMIAEAFVDQFVMGDEFDAMLKEWQQRYKDIMGDEGLSESERLSQLRALGSLISDERDRLTGQTRDILSIFGLDNVADQSASMNMSNQATYEQMDQYLGTQMGIYMATEQGNTIREHILSTLQSMAAATSPRESYGQQIFMRLGTTNEYLLAVKRATETIRDEFGTKLDSMNAKLSKL